MFLPDENTGVPRPPRPGGEPAPFALAPLCAASIAAGFPSPADDFVEGPLDLNAHLIARPAATFIVRVSGTSMQGAGILDGDLLIVDRSLPPAPGDIVVVAVDGELTVKRLGQEPSGGWQLRAEHPDYPPIPLGEDVECTVWGVATGIVRRFDAARGTRNRKR